MRKRTIGGGRSGPVLRIHLVHGQLVFPDDGALYGRIIGLENSRFRLCEDCLFLASGNVFCEVAATLAPTVAYALQPGSWRSSSAAVWTTVSSVLTRNCTGRCPTATFRTTPSCGQATTRMPAGAVPRITAPFLSQVFREPVIKNVTTLLDDTTASSHRSGGCLSVRNDMPAASPANMRYIAVVGTKEVKIASSCRINKNSPPICSILRSRSGVFTSRWSCWHARSSCRPNRPYSRDIHERSCCGFGCR